MLPEVSALLGVDKTVHEPARLAALTLLAHVGDADFTWLQAQTGLTAGNLASHLRRLEADGLVAVDKQFQGRRPQTRYALTPAGKQALVTYRGVLRHFLDATQ